MDHPHIFRTADPAAGGGPKPSHRDRSAIAERSSWDLSHIYPG